MQDFLFKSTDCILIYKAPAPTWVIISQKMDRTFQVRAYAMMELLPMSVECLWLLFSVIPGLNAFSWRAFPPCIFLCSLNSLNLLIGRVQQKDTAWPFLPTKPFWSCVSCWVCTEWFSFGSSFFRSTIYFYSNTMDIFFVKHNLLTQHTQIQICPTFKYPLSIYNQELLTCIYI